MKLSGFVRGLKKVNYKGIYPQTFMAITSFLILTILVMGIFSYCISYNSLMDQIGKEEINAITKTKNSVDVSLKEIEKLMISKSAEQLFQEFINSPYDNQYALMNSTMEGLIDIKNSSRFIQSVYIYIPEYDLIVNSENGRWKLSDFYDRGWLASFEDTASDNWLPTRKVVTNTEENVWVTTLVTAIPFGSTVAVKKGYFIVNIYEEEILRLIQDPSASDGKFSYIIDKDANVITHYAESVLGKKTSNEAGFNNMIFDNRAGNFHFNIKGEKYLVTHIKSDYNNWVYLSMIPDNQAAKSINNIKILNIISIGAFLLLGILAAYLISRKIYKPIFKTIKSIKSYETENHLGEEYPNKENELIYLSKTFERVVESNKNLMSAVHKNESMLKEGFVQDILLRNFTDEIEVEQKLKHFNINFKYNLYFIILISIDKYMLFNRTYSEKDKDLFNFAIKNVAEELINNSGYGLITQTDKDSFGAIVNTWMTRKDMVGMSGEMKEYIKRNFGFSITVSVSTEFTKISDISDAYNEAAEMLKLRIIFGGDRVIAEKRTETVKRTFTLLSNLREEQIYNNLRQGNVEEVDKALSKAVELIQQDQSYPVEEVYQIFYLILGETVKIITEKGWAISDIFGEKYDLYRELIENESIEDMKSWLIIALVRMSHFITEKKESKNQVLIDNILDYINTNYMNDISLNSIAEKVYLSPSYLSRFFKEETGKNYIEYLTDIRIDKSKELLMDSKYKISDISAKVNFGNVQNFIRIFKKYEGLTPGQYREKIVTDERI